jgi:pimeloyl-ACP methyl ester carboxylesterase
MHMFTFIKTTFLLVANLLAFGAAAESLGDMPRLVSAEQINYTSAESFRSMAAAFGQKKIAGYLRYGVRSYKLNYKTTYKGKDIEVSGLMFIPEGTTTSLPIISLQHGTTFVNEDVPSLSGSFTGMEFFASGGFVTLMPDYIGYGESSDVFHPYYTKDHSAGTVIDMIKAAREYLKKEEVKINDQVFLAGYSEGGYVTMAAAEEIQRNSGHNIELAAVAAGAGGYDMVEMLKQVASATDYSYPSYLAFVLMSYNKTYDWNKDLSYFFRPVYAKALTNYMNGKHDGWVINQKLTTDVRSLFNPVFHDGLREPGAEKELKGAIVANTINGWKTDLPIRFYHGTRDEIIPLSNSESTIAKFKNAGATAVELRTMPGGTHGSSFGPMAADFIPWFMEIARIR